MCSLHGSWSPFHISSSLLLLVIWTFLTASQQPQLISFRPVALPMFRMSCAFLFKVGSPDSVLSYQLTSCRLWWQLLDPTGPSFLLPVSASELKYIFPSSLSPPISSGSLSPPVSCFVLVLPSSHSRVVFYEHLVPFFLPIRCSLNASEWIKMNKNWGHQKATHVSLIHHGTRPFKSFWCPFWGNCHLSLSLKARQTLGPFKATMWLLFRILTCCFENLSWCRE